MTTEETTEFHPFARVFTDLLEGKTPDASTVKDIKIRTAPRKGVPQGEEADVEVNVADAPLIEPFHYFNTFDEVTEEWRRDHPKDGQLTKVQVNFNTGEVTVFKKLNAAEIANRRRKSAKGWDSKVFSLDAPEGVRRAASYAFR